MMLDSNKYRDFVPACLARLKTQQQLGAALGARMLCEEKNAGLGLLGSSSITEPRRQWYTRRILRPNATHVENDRAESTSLQKQLGHTERLLYLCPRLAGIN
jgi:hypothetical protein